MTEPSREYPYSADLDAESRSWYALVDPVHSLSPDERLVPGYYREPDWSVRDLAGHIGTWLAEAGVQFERIHAGTYEGHDVDVQALNASFLDAMRDQPWDVTWIQANASRTRMRQAWAELHVPSDEADWWIRKTAVDHYDQHLGRLEAWVEELTGRRASADPS